MTKEVNKQNVASLREKIQISMSICDPVKEKAVENQGLDFSVQISSELLSAVLCNELTGPLLTSVCVAVNIPYSIIIL